MKYLILYAILQAAWVSAADRQDLSKLPGVAEHYLMSQTAGLPGKISITVNPPDVRLKLTMCASLEAFMPPGSRTVGRTTVGIRCLAPSRWAIYLPTRIRQISNYLSVATGLRSDQMVTTGDLLQRSADLGDLPEDVVTDPAKAVGMSLTSSLPPGAPLRRSVLRPPRVIQQGQVTQLVLNGDGFVIHSEGRAIANANIGQTVQIRTDSGQIVSGIAQADHMVAIPY